MREDDNVELLVGRWFGLKPLNTIRDLVHEVRSSYRVKPFCNATAWPNQRTNINRFYSNVVVLKHRLTSENVEYD